MAFFKSRMEQFAEKSAELDMMSKQVDLDQKLEKAREMMKSSTVSRTSSTVSRTTGPDTSRESADYLKPKGLFDIRGRLRKRKDNKHPEKTWLIHMELNNGNAEDFIVSIDRNEFNYLNGLYIIDDDFKYYNISSRLWALDYHQGLSIPIKHHINLTLLKKGISQAGITDIDTAINPLTLKQWLESDVIQKVMKGEELDRYFRLMKLLCIINLVINILVMLILLKTSGILNGVRIPGLG